MNANIRDCNFALKEKLYDALNLFSDFCEQNNLTYFAAYGTCIGAIRHKEIIPWDDDIDLWMPREDYMKLIEKRNALSEIGLDFISIETDRDYFLPFGKVLLKGTTLWEEKKHPIKLGVFIDIFPLESTDMPVKLNKKNASLRRKLSRACCVYDKNDYLKALRTFQVRILVYMLYHTMFRLNHAHYLMKYRDFIEHVSMQSGKYYINLAASPGEVNFFDKNFFKSRKIIPFGPVNIYVPSGYHEILSSIYGDYMQLPPKKEREIGHARYYINLCEELTIEEAKERLKKGENCVF